jgi:hypothetical protein
VEAREEEEEEERKKQTNKQRNKEESETVLRLERNEANKMYSCKV